MKRFHAPSQPLDFCLIVVHHMFVILLMRFIRRILAFTITTYEILWVCLFLLS